MSVDNSNTIGQMEEGQATVTVTQTVNGIHIDIPRIGGPRSL